MRFGFWKACETNKFGAYNWKKGWSWDRSERCGRDRDERDHDRADKRKWWDNDRDDKRGWCDWDRRDRDCDDGHQRKVWHRGHEHEDRKWKGLGHRDRCGDDEPENNAPQITSPLNKSVLSAATFGPQVVADVDAFDPDGDTLIFSLSGDDAHLFDIDEETGVITTIEGDLRSFLSGSDDTPRPVDALDLIVTVTDEGGLTDQVELDIMLVQVA